jgi:uncharacterized phage-associated protein
MNAAAKLALWVRASVGEPITHLKLQKLAFYCYGAALAYDCESEVCPIAFDAWKHGPVNRDIYKSYASHGSCTIPVPFEAVEYTATAEHHLKDALAVYGQLDAWRLRQQSHLERPWVTAYKAQGPIPTEQLKDYFRDKFCGSVEWPQLLL